MLTTAAVCMACQYFRRRMKRKSKLRWRNIVLAALVLFGFVSIMAMKMSSFRIDPFGAYPGINPHVENFPDELEDVLESDEAGSEGVDLSEEALNQLLINASEEESENSDDEEAGELVEVDDEHMDKPTDAPRDILNVNRNQDKRRRRSFGPKNGHRMAHIAARRRLGTNQSSKQRIKFKNPVVEDAEEDLLPFNANLVRDAFKNTPRIEMEAEYFRFEDHFGLIDTGWNDEQVLSAMQRLIDIYAQANIRIRIHRREALARVKLSRERSLAYLFYVDFPKRDSMSDERREHREWLRKFIGPDLVRLFELVDKERQGLLDFIVGWPEERTPWENENVVGMYPSFYYYYMNGGGEGGCMRFRTGDCNTPREIKGTGVQVYCYRFDIFPQKVRATENPVVRSWEAYNFTADMAVRLVAHEMGHAMGLIHPNRGCIKVDRWPSANLMSQVITMAPRGHLCRARGWPHLAATATYLTESQIEYARRYMLKDLRETPTVRGCKKVGKTIEVPPTNCEFKRTPVTGFVALDIPAPKDGRVYRVRWKSANEFKKGDKLIVSIGRFEGNTWRESGREHVYPHAMGAHVHQEHDVDIPIKQGDYVAILAPDRRTRVPGLNPQTHTWSDPEVLWKDVIGEIPHSKRDHPQVNKIISSRDETSVYPAVIPHAHMSDKVMTRMQNDEWIENGSCAEWIFNYDLYLEP